MNTLYVNQKSELTQLKVTYEACGMEVFRARMGCNCRAGENRRYGILAVNSNCQVVVKAIRCKACKKGGGHGNI